jgi:hypothetical protein
MNSVSMTSLRSSFRLLCRGSAFPTRCLKHLTLLSALLRKASRLRLTPDWTLRFQSMAAGERQWAGRPLRTARMDAWRRRRLHVRRDICREERSSIRIFEFSTGDTFLLCRPSAYSVLLYASCFSLSSFLLICNCILSSVVHVRMFRKECLIFLSKFARIYTLKLV